MATDNEEREKEEEEEEKSEREEREDELQEEGSLQNLTLWSKLADLAVENKLTGTVEDSSVVDVEANGPMESDLHMSDLSVTSSEDRIANVMSPSNSTKDVDSKYLPSNVQSYQIEQLVHVKTDGQSMTEKELPFIPPLDSTTYCGINSEVSLENKAKELKSCGSDGTQLNSDMDSEHERLFDGLTANLLTRDELLALFKTLHREKQQKTADCSQKLLTTVGLVSKVNYYLIIVRQLEVKTSCITWWQRWFQKKTNN